MNAPFASGSNPPDVMVVIPCTMGTMGRIAHGYSEDVLLRAADVVLKEKKKLILVPRETPLSLIHVKNMELLLLADETILGQVLTAAQGQNPARQAARAAGIPDAKTAFGINQVCGSGLRAVALAAQQIRSGESDIVIAGGQESMSQSTHAAYLRAGQKMGDVSFIDTMIKDGLWDAFNGYHMGITAENVAKAGRSPAPTRMPSLWPRSRRRPPRRRPAVQGRDHAGHVDEPQGRNGGSEDEYIRHDASAETMAKLRPAFTKEGTVTAGNASALTTARPLWW